MIYEHFCMRIHDDQRANMADPTSWKMRTQEGALIAFVVGSVFNPAPVPKTQGEDVPGASGTLDLTEASGRVTFENKEVTVVLSGQADFQGMEELEHVFSAYQGRRVDFTFDNYLNVEWYQVGRMVANFDHYRKRVTLTFDAEPFRYGTSTEYIREMKVLQNYEVERNSDAWLLSSAPAYSGDNKTNFTFSVETPGESIIRKKNVGVSSGYFALGIQSLVGGEVEFMNVDEETHTIVFSKTVAKIWDVSDAPDEKDNPGQIRMRVTVDGSYYEWHTVNGVAKYLPTVKCSYILSSYLPENEDGGIDDSVLAELPSNVMIRPDFSNSDYPGVIIVDGVACNLNNVTGEILTLPRVKMPGDRADLSGMTAKSIFVAVPKTPGNEPYPTIGFYPAEVF